MPTLTPAPTRASGPGDRTMLRASALVAAALVVVGLLGTLSMRGWGEVPFTVPSPPWYHSWPYYLFWAPEVDWRWAMIALPLAVAIAAALVAAAAPGARGRRSRPLWLAGSLAGAFALDLAVAALGGGPAAWRAPLAYIGEYAPAVPQVGPIPQFLRDFPERVPTLPTFPNQHPPGPTVLYALVDRVWSGLDGAAVATVAMACLGLLVVAALARDELGATGERVAVVCWALAPAVVLYSATSADAMWVPVLAGGALAAHRGLLRRSLSWTIAGGVLLWMGSMLTYAAVLVLPFLAVRAAAVALAPRRLRARDDAEVPAPPAWRWVVRWAAVTTATVLALAALLWLLAGYDVVAGVRAVGRSYDAATAAHTRVWWTWVLGDLAAFVAILGFPLAAGLLAGTGGALRRRAWGSFEAATLASLLTGALWGFTKGEVERMWQFLVPFAVVVAVGQLLRWRASLPLLAAMLLAQTVAIQMLFFTRW
jgi:methylthioxylose transferase